MRKRWLEAIVNGVFSGTILFFILKVIEISNTEDLASLLVLIVVFVLALETRDYTLNKLKEKTEK